MVLDLMLSGGSRLDRSAEKIGVFSQIRMVPRRIIVPCGWVMLSGQNNLRVACRKMREAASGKAECRSTLVRPAQRRRSREARP